MHSRFFFTKTTRKTALSPSSIFMTSATFVKLPSLGDHRGSLIAIEGGQTIPFDIARVYYLYGTKADVTRGLHAHKALRQVAIVVSGSCLMTLDNGKERVALRLDSPDKGLLIESMMWREMTEFSPDCVLLVIADSHYDEDDYIRDYDEFLKATKG